MTIMSTTLRQKYVSYLVPIMMSSLIFLLPAITEEAGARLRVGHQPAAPRRLRSRVRPDGGQTQAALSQMLRSAGGTDFRIMMVAVGIPVVVNYRSCDINMTSEVYSISLLIAASQYSGVN